MPDSIALRPLDRDDAPLMVHVLDDRGYASAAMAAFLRELAQRGVDRLIAHIQPDHEASNRIAARIGLAPTATLVDGELRWAGGLKTP